MKDQALTSSVGTSRPISKQRPFKLASMAFRFCFLVVFASASLFLSPSTYATTSSVTLTLSGNPTITLPPSANGKFVDSGNKNISISTTHAAGYTLSIRATGAYNPTSLDTNGGVINTSHHGFLASSQAGSSNQYALEFITSSEISRKTPANIME